MGGDRAGKLAAISVTLAAMTRDHENEARMPAIWEPMRLDYIGSVAELMRSTNTGSKRDEAQGCGTTRRRTAVGGTPCD